MGFMKKKKKKKTPSRFPRNLLFFFQIIVFLQAGTSQGAIGIRLLTVRFPSYHIVQLCHHLDHKENTKYTQGIVIYAISLSIGSLTFHSLQ
ncbi:hypothetical protein GDO81_009015 [Engystomops pustulosus]|uniref:Uncharacterized protein n=1 Tax=Engystomops pustulosus TaxID=76066 RepID=A0AAV7BMY1_ENGPU|nr:hypothetical protein GDO81_009015 [Engystomops pustulosus]